MNARRATSKLICSNAAVVVRKRRRWVSCVSRLLHGVTKPITVKLEEYTEAATTKFGYRAGFLCTFTIKRSDYGMTSFMDQLGDEVQIIAAIEGARE